MSFQVISDIHLEYLKDVKLKDLITPNAIYLIIAGDLGNPSKNSYSLFLEEASLLYKKVFLITGNHEYYQYDKTIEEIDILITKIISKFNNVYFLNNSSYLLDDVILLGTTLWTNIPNNKYHLIKQNINDYRLIYKTKDELITPTDINSIYKKNIEWLSSEIESYHDKNIIIITHHLPSLKMISPKFITNTLNCSFYSDLNNLMKKNVKYWLCGHTHQYMYKQINDTVCICNPIGCPYEDTGYKKDLTFIL